MIACGANQGCENEHPAKQLTNTLLPKSMKGNVERLWIAFNRIIKMCTVGKTLLGGENNLKLLSVNINVNK